jgi:hypothetical protein
MSTEVDLAVRYYSLDPGARPRKQFRELLVLRLDRKIRKKIRHRLLSVGGFSGELSGAPLNCLYMSLSKTPIRSLRPSILPNERFDKVKQ